MFAFFKSGKVKSKKHYDKQKQLLASGGIPERLKLAQNKKTQAEILYYLALDADDAVRAAVANNPALPPKARLLLAKDGSVDVRLGLAARLVELLPHLSTDKQSQMYAYTVQALGFLAQDEVLKIRKALSSALKDCADAPTAVARQLAFDIEREVSEPILRYCAALSDDDLLEILSSHPAGWAASAVAGRAKLSGRVSEAVIMKGDMSAVNVLLANSGAELPALALQNIVDKAKEYPAWHEPISLRKELTADIARTLAGFVNASVLRVMENRKDFDVRTRKEITQIVQRRLEYQDNSLPHETAQNRLDRYVRTRKLDANVVHDALVWLDFEFVVLALAYLSRIPPVIAEKMLRAGAARPIIALCWKAGVPMRLCIALQKDFSRLPPKDMVYAKGGTDYPMTPQEIQWMLEFYGVATV